MAVEYVDIFSPQLPEHPASARLLAENDVPLPLISFNGRPRLAGGISVGRISEEIESLGVMPLDAPAEG